MSFVRFSICSSQGELSISHCNLCRGQSVKARSNLHPDWGVYIFSGVGSYRHVCKHATKFPSQASRTASTSTRNAPLRILLKSLSHSIVGRRVPSHPKLLVLIVAALASVPDKRSFGFLWSVVDQRKGVERVFRVVALAFLPCSVLTHSGELHRADARGKPVVHYALSDYAEARLLQPLREHCKVQPESVILGYISSSPTLRMRDVGQNGGASQRSLIGIMHEATM